MTDWQALEDEWCRIVAERDAEAARELLAGDFVLASAGGVSQRADRDAWLDALARIETRSLTAEVDDVRVIGDAAVVKASLRWEAAMGERDLTGDYVVADVWRREDGRWRAVWRISTRLGAS